MHKPVNRNFPSASKRQKRTEAFDGSLRHVPLDEPLVLVNMAANMRANKSQQTRQYVLLAVTLLMPLSQQQQQQLGCLREHHRNLDSATFHCRFLRNSERASLTTLARTHSTSSCRKSSSPQHLLPPPPHRRGPMGTD